MRTSRFDLGGTGAAADLIDVMVGVGVVAVGVEVDLVGRVKSGGYSLKKKE